MRFFLPFLLLILSQWTFGQVIASQSFVGSIDSSISPYTNGITVASGFSYSGIQRGALLTPVILDNAYVASNFSTSAIDVVNQNFTFTVAPQHGQLFTLSKLTLGLVSNGTIYKSSIYAEIGGNRHVLYTSNSINSLPELNLDRQIFAGLNQSVKFTISFALTSGRYVGFNTIVLSGQEENLVESVSNGAWDSPTTWVTGSVPTASQKVLVQSGHTVSLPGSITRNASSEIYGNITINQPTQYSGIALSYLESNTLRFQTNIGNDAFQIGGVGSCNELLVVQPDSFPKGTEVNLYVGDGANFTSGVLRANGVEINNYTLVNPQHIRVVFPDSFEHGKITFTNTNGCEYVSENSTPVLLNESGSCGTPSTTANIYIHSVLCQTDGSTIVAVYNPSTTPVNLSSYSVRFYQRVPTNNSGSVTLSGTLTPYTSRYFVIAPNTNYQCTEFTPPLITRINGTMNFTSGQQDDFELYKGGTLIDWFGSYTNNWMNLNYGDNGILFKRLTTVTRPSTNFNLAHWTVTDVKQWSCEQRYQEFIRNVHSTAGIPTNVSYSIYGEDCLKRAYSGSLNLTGFRIKDWVVIDPWGNPIDLNQNNDFSFTTVSNNKILVINNKYKYENYQIYYSYDKSSSAFCTLYSKPLKIGSDIKGTAWDGNSWNPSVPTIDKPAVLKGDYDTAIHGYIDACFLIQETGTLSIRSGNYVNLTSGIQQETQGKIQIYHGGSLVLSTNNALQELKGENFVERTPSPVNKFDYVYWGSMTDEATLQNTFTGWRTDYAYRFKTENFSDLGPNGIPDGYDDNGDVWQPIPSQEILKSSKGFIVMAPTNLSSYPAQTTVRFNGTFVNGTVSHILSHAQHNYRTADWNLICNPYPSAINATQFINNAGSKISGTLYYWTHRTPIQIAANSYTANDYAMFNLTGGTQASPSGGDMPTNVIPSGQAFFIEANFIETLTITNNMRVKNPQSSQFFRLQHTDNLEEKDRLWLEMKNAQGFYSQQLIGYLPETTLGTDWAYDGAVNSGENAISFYSLIDEEAYRIQSRGNFDSSDVVRLGYSSVVDGNFEIGTSNIEGVLTDHPLYLEDFATGVIHDLQSGNYHFQTNAGTFNNRFQLRYQMPLSVAGFEADASVVFRSDSGTLGVRSSNETIKTITVYNLLGQVIHSNQSVDALQYELEMIQQKDAVVLVHLTLQSGRTVQVKVRL